MSNSIPCIVAQDSVSLMLDGDMKVFTNSHINYLDIRQAIKDGAWDLVRELVDVGAGIAKFSSDKIELKNGSIYYKGMAIHNTLTVRILDMKNEGFNVDPMLLFLENLMQNPSHRAVQELYGFLESVKLPLTDDGCFLAYKMVRDNFTDIYSGKFDNSPGSVVEMERNQVDEDKDRTCSYGLHFCSRGYLGEYGGSHNSRVVIVKINPRDVVAIPADYNNTKGRCCRYEVLYEAQIAVSSTDSMDEFTESVVETGANTVDSHTTDSDLEFFDVREESDGTFTALFEFKQAAWRICNAVDPLAALRKRIKRGSVSPEYYDGKELYRAQMDELEVKEWRDQEDNWYD